MEHAKKKERKKEIWLFNKKKMELSGEKEPKSLHIPLTVKTAELETIPPELRATHVYSPASATYALEISSWQLSSN